MMNQQRQILERMKFTCMGAAYKFYSKLKTTNKKTYQEMNDNDYKDAGTANTK